MNLLSQPGVTPGGVAFSMLPPVASGDAPLLLLLAMAGGDTLSVEPYCDTGQLLHAKGWNVLSLDLPCHGADRRPGEPESLAGWAVRTAAGEDWVAAFQVRVNAVLGHAVERGWAAPGRMAAAGTSRGGYMAFQAAAGNPALGAVAAFAPVTDLAYLREFAALGEHPLVRGQSLEARAPDLAGRAVWMVIGHADERVGTDRARAAARALERATAARGLQSRVTLEVQPVPGHATMPGWHEAAAEWLEKQRDTL